MSLNALQLNGFLVINKPAQMSSARVVSTVKKILNVRKVGHTGTLDPFATGVLICCINDATRLARFFLNGWKTYQADVHLGVETDTLDLTGTVTDLREIKDYTRLEIESACQKFIGDTRQHPPVYSALKHNGTPLYKLARSGRPVQKPPRGVSISSIKLIDIQLPMIRFEVNCSAGTYIRTLSADIGTELGCGAHLKALKRISSSGFSLDDAVDLSNLERISLQGRLSRTIISMTDALKYLPEYTADNLLTQKIKHGIILNRDEISPDTEHPEGYLKIIDSERNLLTVVQADQNRSNYKYVCVLRT